MPGGLNAVQGVRSGSATMTHRWFWQTWGRHGSPSGQSLAAQQAPPATHAPPQQIPLWPLSVVQADRFGRSLDRHVWVCGSQMTV